MGKRPIKSKESNMVHAYCHCHCKWIVQFNRFFLYTKCQGNKCKEVCKQWNETIEQSWQFHHIAYRRICDDQIPNEITKLRISIR